MTKSPAETPAAYAPTKRETIVEFSPVELQAPFLLRVGSMIIDYLVLLLLPVTSMLYRGVFGESLNIMTDRTLWLISVLLFLANIIVLPLLFGRSLGKMLTGLRVVRSDGSDPGILNIALRQTLGYLITAVTLGIGFIWCVFSSKGRTLHDVLTDTVVVRGSRRIV
ncbi:MAG: RDD family protein [Acidobacteriota bacterium]